MLYKVLNKTKETTDIKKFDNDKILIYKDDKLPDDITLKNVVKLMRCKKQISWKYQDILSFFDTLSSFLRDG